MIQAFQAILFELSTRMQEMLGTSAPFPLDTVPPDNVFTEDMLETVAYCTSDLREFHEYILEENPPAPVPVMEDTGAGAARNMAGFTYHVNLAMIIGRHR